MNKLLRDSPRPINILHQHPQYFGHAPRLCDTSPRLLRRITVEDLGDLTESAVGKVVSQRCQPFDCLAARRDAALVHLYICGDERSHQPRPNGAQMIGAVALEWTT